MSAPDKPDRHYDDGPEAAYDLGLERMYQNTPRFGDADAFTARVAQRLNQRWSLRGAALGITGVVGGLVAVSQMIGIRSTIVPDLMAFRALTDNKAVTSFKGLSVEAGGVLTRGDWPSAGNALDFTAQPVYFFALCAAVLLLSLAYAFRVFDEA
ncbi:MAG: hypothetical protein ACK41P_08130 [Asticcacaulis sp.]